MTFGTNALGRDFRLLWTAETVSNLGSQFTTLALPLTAAVFLNCSIFQLGLLSAALTLPVAVFGLPAGWWVDGHACRPMLVGTYILRALVMFGLTALYLTSSLNFYWLLIGAFLLGTGNILFELAIQAIVPRLLKPRQLSKANSAFGTSAAAAEVIGPGMAGSVLQTLGGPAAFAVDALSFSCAAFLTIGIRSPEKVPTAARWSVRDLFAGLKRTASDPMLRAFAGEAGTYNVFFATVQVALIPFAVRDLGLGAGVAGIVLSTASIGALTGAVATPWLGRRWGLGRTVVATSIIGALPLLLLPFVSGPSAAYLLGALLAVRGFGVSACNVQVYSIRQVATPSNFLGRTNAVYRVIVSGLLPAGALAGGIIGNVFGLTGTLVVGGSGVACSCLWLVMSPVRNLRAIDEITPVPDPPVNQSPL